MTSYIGLVLLALLVLFTLANTQARRSLKSYDPLIAGVVAILIVVPHLLWLSNSPDGVLRIPVGLRTPAAIAGSFAGWLRQLALIFAAHAGLLVLVGLVAGWPWPRREPAPIIVRRGRRSVRPTVRLFLCAGARSGRHAVGHDHGNSGTGRRQLPRSSSSPVLL